MKTPPLAVALLALSVATLGAQPASPQVAAATALPSTPWTVDSRGANHNVWQRTTYEMTPSGQSIPRVHQYVELSSGLNHWLASSQTWVPSTTEIDGYPGGAVATNGQTRVIFANNLNTAAPVVFEGPDGKQFQSKIIGLAYEDLASGSNVIIAQIQNSEGYISSNTVIYSNAFTGDVSGSVVYIYRLSGLEQDVVLQSQPPPPEAFGLSSQSTVLQAITEFAAPQPQIRTLAMANAGGFRMSDQFLDFGAIKMRPGKAFMIGQNRLSRVAICKRWDTNTIPGQSLLLESVAIPSIANQLGQLPVSPQASIKPVSGGVLNAVSTKRLLPTLRLAKANSGAMKVARTASPRKGFVMDYQTINGAVADYTLQADTTYFVPESGEFDVDGTLTIEGGTVVKYGPSSSGIYVWNNPIICQTGPYRPAVFTDMNDNSVGGTISGSTGVPSDDCLGDELYGYSAAFHDLRFEYTETALYESQASDVSDCQFLSCGESIVLNYGEFSANNLLFATPDAYSDIEYVDSPPPGYDNVIIASFVTSIGGIFAMGDADPGVSYLYLTNAIIFGALTNDEVNRTYTNSVALNPPGNMFQKVAGGDFYLAANSPYRNAGTTNMDPAVLADIATKTTYPPIVYTNVTFSTATTFSPQAQRDTDTPDLGYHYYPLDWAFGGCTAASNMTFTAGTAVGWFRTTSGWQHAGQAIQMSGQITVSFNGTATLPVYWVRLNTVQEQDLTAGYGHGSIENWSGPALPLVQGTFMRCSAMANEQFNGYFADDYGGIAAILTHSEFWSGALGTYGDQMFYTNCLMRRVYMGLWNGGPVAVRTLRNCTFIGGSFVVDRSSSYPVPVSVRDCAFDGTTISTSDYWGSDSSVSDYDYNAYTNTTDPFSIGGVHDKTGVTFNWQTGPFGTYYLPSDSVLIDAGDVTADQVELYHFTTQTNANTVEGDSVVDIGYHYVGVDANGNPIDTNGDGIPDYLQDANGNGLVDSGEINWQTSGDVGLQVWITEPKNNSILP